MNIKNVKIEEIKPYNKNAKKHDKKQIQQVADSIKRFGFVQPIVIDKNNEVVIGHCSLEAAKLLGLKDVPTVSVENLSDEEVKALRLADNKLNESAWDMNLVIEDLKGLDNDLLDLTGFDRDLIIEGNEKDDVIPDSAPAIAQTGDIWALGRHRVMCGSSTDKKNIDKLMDGAVADLVFTDPPYGINLIKNEIDGIGGGGELGFAHGEQSKAQKAKTNINRGLYRKIIGDDKDFDPTFLVPLAKEAIIFGANNFSDKLPVSPHWLVWDKKNDGAERRNTFSDAELMWTNIKGVSVKTYRWNWNGITRKGNRTDELKTRCHPTQKPVGLLAEVIMDYAVNDNIILDPFLGSGSTLIACEKTNRICYGMEIDEKYVDVIIKRWEDYTGNKAIKVSD